MSKIATARWPQKCSLCSGDILYGDAIVTYSGKGSYKKTHHHLKQYCYLYNNEKIVVDTQSHSMKYFDRCLEILKEKDGYWALEEISKIAKVDVSSDIYGDRAIELHALGWLVLKLESKEIGLGLIKDISHQAIRNDVKSEAIKILEDYE